MKDFFLTDEQDSKTLYKKIMAQTADVIAGAFIDDKAYTGRQRTLFINGSKDYGCNY